VVHDTQEEEEEEEEEVEYSSLHCHMWLCFTLCVKKMYQLSSKF